MLSNLLSIAELELEVIENILERAKGYIGHRGYRSALGGGILAGSSTRPVMVNLFCEPSTRTRVSFELAAKRLGFEVINLGGEVIAAKSANLIDTAVTLDAMHPEVMVVRHAGAGAAKLVSRYVTCPVINAGDGRHEHPTQALLDALTILQHKPKLQGLVVTICGDILHSRVARSNIQLLSKSGAHLRLVGPATLLPQSWFPCEQFYELKPALTQADVVMVLRLQTERMTQDYIPSTREYFHFFGLTHDKLRWAKPEVLVMHPGPVERGVEIDGTLADDLSCSVITQQVELGVAVRMACLDLLTARQA